MGSLLSINSLHTDLGVAFETVERWISILEKLYYCYRIKPFGVKTEKAIKKEKKLFLWDWSMCSKNEAKFENLVASNLLKYCHFHEDNKGRKLDLQFIRDREGREIDFVVVEKNIPLFAVECKSGEDRPSKHIAYFKERTRIPRFFQVHQGKSHYLISGLSTEVLPFKDFCFDFLKI